MGQMTENGKEMSSWAKDIFAVTLFVEDLKAARKSIRRSSACPWYSRMATRPYSNSEKR